MKVVLRMTHNPVRNTHHHHHAKDHHHHAKDHHHGNILIIDEKDDVSNPLRCAFEMPDICAEPRSIIIMQALRPSQ